MLSPVLCAVILTKNEASNIARCVNAVAEVVDEVLVIDTGSSDATCSFAREAGAHVATIEWPGSFAEARNSAAKIAEQMFGDDLVIVVVDADEIAIGDREELRRTVRLHTGIWTLVQRNSVAPGSTRAPWSVRCDRVYRPSAASFAGAVHERLHGEGVRLDLEEKTLRVDHDGYSQDSVVIEKGKRNTALARQGLASVTDKGQQDMLLFDLGRSLVAAGDRRAALETLVELRERKPDASLARACDGQLVPLLMAEGQPSPALGILAELDGHVDPVWHSWWKGQAQVQLGQIESGLVLLRAAARACDVRGEGPVDPERRKLSPASVWLALCLGELLCGRHSEARDALLRAEQLGSPSDQALWDMIESHTP